MCGCVHYCQLTLLRKINYLRAKPVSWRLHSHIINNVLTLLNNFNSCTNTWHFSPLIRVHLLAHDIIFIKYFAISIVNWILNFQLILKLPIANPIFQNSGKALTRSWTGNYHDNCFQSSQLTFASKWRRPYCELCHEGHITSI